MPRRNTGARLRWIERRGIYYIVWYEQGRERLRSTGETDQQRAESILATFIRATHRPASGPRPAHEVSIAEILDFYGTNKGAFAKDTARIGYAIDALLPFWGKLTAMDVNDARCGDYGRWRARAPATVRRELGTLAAALNYSFGRIVDAKMPVALPPKTPGKDRWLTRSEAARLLNAARTARGDVRLYLPLFILLGLYTGARKEAILSLRWSQIDLANRRINFKHVSGAETAKRRAHIRIPRRLGRFLAYAHERRRDDAGFVVHDKGKQVIDIGGAWDGNEDPAAYVQGSFGRACKRAGIVDATPHTLRHTVGTWMAQQGVSLAKIGEFLGHTDSRTTALYAHHHPDYQGEQADALDRRR
jgi:integrase